MLTQFDLRTHRVSPPADYAVKHYPREARQVRRIERAEAFTGFFRKHGQLVAQIAIAVAVIAAVLIAGPVAGAGL